jgi:putative transposase
MARIARVVFPGIPHHVTQRGNRRQETFFCDEDYAEYLALLTERCEHWGVEVWAYCLMTNHVHLVAVPATADGLARAIGEAHRRYTRMVNFRENWRGYLWQGRFASFPMDAAYLMAAARYVELNPVRAKMCRAPWAYKWSSAAAHVAGKDDVLVRAAPLIERLGVGGEAGGDEWKRFLLGGLDPDEAAVIRRHERTGRPLGPREFVERLERMLGRSLRRQKPGPKPKHGGSARR